MRDRERERERESERKRGRVGACYLRVPHARERGHEQHKRRKEEEEEEEVRGEPPRGVSALAHLLNEVCVCARCLSLSHKRERRVARSPNPMEARSNVQRGH